MDVLIYANPYSGSKDNLRLVGRLESALVAEGMEPEVVWKLPGRAEQLLEVGHGLKAVVAAGGDGSINTTVNLMRETEHLHLPFATLPVGTENLFAKQFGYDVTRPEAIAAAIAGGRTEAVDLGEVRPMVEGRPDDAGGRLFTLMASAGFDAAVVHKLDAWRTDLPDGALQRVSKISYVAPVTRSLLGYGFPRVTLSADGREVTGSQAYVFNLPQYGGNIGIGRHTRVGDGQLHWVVFEKPGRLRLFAYHALCLINRHLQTSTVHHGHAAEVTIASSDGHGHTDQGDAAAHAPVQADGDPAGQTPQHFRVLPGALHVVRLRSEG